MRLPSLERLKLNAPVLFIGGSVQCNQDVSNEGVATTRFATLPQNCSNPRKLMILPDCNALGTKSRLRYLGD